MNENSIATEYRRGLIRADRAFYRLRTLEWMAKEKTDVKSFYLNHLLLYTTLDLGVNTAIMVTYSNPKKLLKDLRLELNQMPEVKDHLRYLVSSNAHIGNLMKGAKGEKAEKGIIDIFDLFPQFNKWHGF